ncbi:hypothetical protein [Halonotius pteroides]|uniref:Uncharacterized protein n=1 Tax=Halonotius pteroides TaxID=268735 RepID=A0A3A6PXS9_9EURY|nr:hypothetical protein [Halonotius pteroides]RJX48204.1 hypothetical protein DP106_12830 [Halonotius pteroides]
MAPEQSVVTFSVGDSVADTGDDDPDGAIVVNCPTDKTIADWKHETDSGTTTAAAESPEYLADEQLIIVAFRDAIADTPDNWQNLDPDTLFEQVVEHDINQYGFRAGRLEQIEPGELGVCKDKLQDCNTKFQAQYSGDRTQFLSLRR